MHENNKTEDGNETQEAVENLQLESGFDNGWSNPPKVTQLKQEMEDAIPNHSAQVERMDAWIENLNGKTTANPQNKNKKAKTRSEYTPRLIRKQAEWRYPSLTEPFLNTPNMFEVSPQTHMDKEGAIQAGQMINHQFNNKINKVKYIDDLVRATVDEGTAIVRTGWDYRTRTESRDVPEIEYVVTDDQEYAQRIQQLIQAAQQNPEVLDQLPEEQRTALELTVEQGVPVQAIATGKMISEDYEVVVADQPTLEVCDYRSVIIDPTCRGDIENANFVIYKFETSKSDLQATGLYSNLEKINLEDSSILKESDDIIDSTDIQSFNFRDEPRKRIIAYEYWGFWDTKGDGIARPIVCTFVGNVMVRAEDNPFSHGKLPFDVCQLMPKRREIYGEPDGELILDNQKVVGALSRGMIDLMAKSANGQTAYAKGFLDPLNKRRRDNQESYEFNPTAPPEQAIFQHKYPEIPQSAYNMVSLHQNEAESFTGVKAFAGGLSGDSLGSSVGGIRSALDAAGKREMSILRRVVSLMNSVGKKILAMNGQFLDGTQFVKVTDKEFVEVNPDDITGEYDLVLDISTAEADNAKASELAFMLQTLGNSAPFEVTKMLLVDIARLRKLPSLVKQLEEWEPTPDPMAEQMQQIELKIKMAEAIEMETRAKKNLAAAEVNLANARKLGSDADMKDLDYVEQETGTKHARDADLMRQQSEGNIKHALVKGQLDKEKEIEKGSNTVQNG
jgi:hypothetical protein